MLLLALGHFLDVRDARPRELADLEYGESVEERLEVILGAVLLVAVHAQGREASRPLKSDKLTWLVQYSFDVLVLTGYPKVKNDDLN